MKHVAVTGGAGGGLPENTLYRSDSGEGLYVPFRFCKKGKPGKTERLRFISGFLQIKMAIIMELASCPCGSLGTDSGCAAELCVSVCGSPAISLFSWGLLGKAAQP